MCAASSSSYLNPEGLTYRTNNLASLGYHASSLLGMSLNNASARGMNVTYNVDTGNYEITLPKGADKNALTQLVSNPRDLKESGGKILINERSISPSVQLFDLSQYRVQGVQQHSSPSSSREAPSPSLSSPDAPGSRCEALEQKINDNLAAQGRDARVSVTYKNGEYLFSTKGIIDRDDLAIITSGGDRGNITANGEKWAIAEDRLSSRVKGELAHITQIEKPGFLSKVASFLHIPGARQLAGAVPVVATVVAVDQAFSATQQAMADENVTPGQTAAVVASHAGNTIASVLPPGLSELAEEITAEIVRPAGVSPALLATTSSQDAVALIKLASQYAQEHSSDYAAALTENQWRGEMGSLKLILAQHSNEPEKAIAMLEEMHTRSPEMAKAFADAIIATPDKADSMVEAYNQAKEQGITQNPQMASQEAGAGEKTAAATPQQENAAQQRT